MKRTGRFALVMSKKEKTALEQLAEYENLSQAATVRRLIRIEAIKLGLYELPKWMKDRQRELDKGEETKT